MDWSSSAAAVAVVEEVELSDRQGYDDESGPSAVRSKGKGVQGEGDSSCPPSDCGMLLAGISSIRADRKSLP